MSDREFIEQHRLDEVMEHLAFALLQHQPEDHAAFALRWLKNLAHAMADNGTPESCFGVNLFHVDGTSHYHRGGKSRGAPDPSSHKNLSKPIGAGGTNEEGSTPRLKHSKTAKGVAFSKSLSSVLDRLDPADHDVAAKVLERLVARREEDRKAKVEAEKQKTKVTNGLLSSMNESGNAHRRIAVSATPMVREKAAGYKPPVYHKSESELSELLSLLGKSTLFSNMSEEERLDIALAMRKVNIGAGEAILKQGYPSNDLLYLTMSGSVDVIKDGKVVASCGSGQYFGELELMTNVPACAATVQTATEVEAYTLEKDTYENLVLNFTLAHREKFSKLIEQVEFFKALPEYERLTLSEALTTQRFDVGDTLIRCGEQGNWMYIITEGTVRVVGREGEKKVNIIDLEAGNVVGELEFLFKHDAVADVVALTPVTAARMNRQHFELCCGSVEDNLKQFIATGKYDHYIAQASAEVHDELKAAQKRKEKRAGDELLMQDAADLDFMEEGEIVFGSQNRRQLFRFPLAPTQHDKLCLVGIQEDGTVLFWNSTMQQLTRYEQAQAVGCSIFSFAATPADQRALFELVAAARKWAGNADAFFASDYHRKNISLSNANGISLTHLNMSVIPPTVAQPKNKAEVFLLIAHEAKKKPPPLGFDIGEWFVSDLKPRVDRLTKEVALLEASVGPSSTRSGGSGSGTAGGVLSSMDTEDSREGSPILPDQSHAPTPMSNATVAAVVRQAKRVEQSVNAFEPLIQSDYHAAVADWSPAQVQVMISRVQTEVSAALRAQGNFLILQVAENVPTGQVYMDVTQLSDTLIYLLTEVNRRVRDGAINLEVSCLTAEEATALSEGVAGQSQTTRSNQSKARTKTPTFQESVLVSRGSSLEVTGAAGAGGKSTRLSGGTVIVEPMVTHHLSEMPSSAAAGEEKMKQHRVIRYCISTPSTLLEESLLNELSTPLALAGGESAVSKRQLMSLGSEDETAELYLSVSDNRVRKLELKKCRATVSKIGGTFVAKNTIREVQGKGGAVAQRPGLSFELQFPLLEGETAASADSAESISDFPKRTFTTVIVEPHPLYRNTVCQYLWGRKHAVLPANSWAEVLQLIKAGTCDILIIDPQAILEEVTTDDGIPVDPINLLQQYTNQMAIIITSESFDPELCAKADITNGILPLCKPPPISILHIVVHAAEGIVSRQKEEHDRITAFRETLNKTKRGEIKIGRLLGKGAFGGVYEVQDVLTNGTMAMKQLKVTESNKDQIEELRNEVETMTTLQHENIIHYFYCQRTDDHLNVFMELANGGSIANRIKEYPEGLPLEVLVPLLRDTMKGLSYLHANSIVHCDIKPANVLLNAEGKAKLGDFGTAKKLKPGELLYVMRGTPNYMAPEVMNADIEQNVGFGFPADIWSIGCMVLEMATGKPPFYHVPSTGGPMGLFAYVSELKDTPDLSPLFSKAPVVFEFVKACLEVDPLSRASAKELMNYSLLSGGGQSERAAAKLVARAKLLHTLNKFVAFQDPEDNTKPPSRMHSAKRRSKHGQSHRGGSKEKENGASSAHEEVDAFFDSEEEDEETDGNSPDSAATGSPPAPLPKKRGEADFFADSDEEAEEDNEEEDTTDSDVDHNAPSVVEINVPGAPGENTEDDEYRSHIFLLGENTRRTNRIDRVGQGWIQQAQSFSSEELSRSRQSKLDSSASDPKGESD
jgi:serine/threonine protein kinase/CRP-like cAMP-binding protein